MIKAKTVFILGAGASYPYGYPLGKDLRLEICKCFSDQYISWLHRENSNNDAKQTPDYSKQTTESRKFAGTFDASKIKSIDKFLALNPEFQLYGKLAIVFRILEAEANSKCKLPDQDWYSWLFNEMIDEIEEKKDYAKFSTENNISFVTFNYDRSLENFLFTSLINSFNGIEEPEIVKQINSINIVHVFGSIAPLKWQDPNGIEFQKHIKEIDVETLPDRLRIIYDKGENPNIEAAQKLIIEADRVFFLGFGYAKENLNILNFREIHHKGQRIFGTAIGFNEKEIKDVLNRLGNKTNSRPIIGSEKNCLTLLRDHLE